MRVQKEKKVKPDMCHRYPLPRGKRNRKTQKERKEVSSFEGSRFGNKMAPKINGSLGHGTGRRTGKKARRWV